MPLPLPKLATDNIRHLDRKPHSAFFPVSEESLEDFPFDFLYLLIG